jgi:hypothetical protein
MHLLEGEAIERYVLLKQIASENDAKKKQATPETKNDCLRFILCFEDDDIRSKYILSQDSLTRIQLDDQNAANREADFFDLIVQKLNDEQWVAKTESLPDLHDDYLVLVISISKGSFTLTRKKTKSIIIDRI